MKQIRNLSFRKKLIALLLPPVLGAIIFAGYNLNAAIHEKSVVNQISPLVDLSITGSLIVHELQKERGATTGFIGSGGAAFKDTLANQRQVTDGVIRKEVEFIRELGDFLKAEQPKIQQSLERILAELDKLPQLRTRVDQLAISAPNAAKYFTDLNASILSLSGSIANLSTQGELTTRLRNYYTFMQAKESAGQERAILNIALSKGSFPPGIYRKVVMLESFQQAYLKIFEQFASPAQMQQLNAIRSSSDAIRVQEIRAIANQKYIEGNFGVTGQEWFQKSTARINQLKSLEDNLASDIHELVSNLDNAASQAILYSSILTLVIVLITLVLSVVVSRLLIHQALNLAETIDSVAKQKDLSLRTKVQSTDELGTSANSLNQMLVVFSDMLKEVEASSVQLATAAEQTSASVAENAKSLERQSLETAQAASATEEMTATVNEIASSTARTVESANQAADLSSEGMSEVESNYSNMSELNEQMTLANSQVLQLRDSSKAINEIVDVIKGIAEQTNLLALNAAIEAARAGEQGRGFAVVADEVRTLAQRTQESTQKIEQMVTGFQLEADDVSKSIESSFAHVKESLEQTVSVKDKLVEINSAIVMITDMCNQVATAAEEQVAATNEVAVNIRTINDLAEMSADAGNQISTAAAEQTELSTKQHELVAQFKL
ncbi:methyl-accepting chemotaxis protein [Shewanella gelidii]|uniref:Methyl-accepting chemotaxis protein n=1 Tax=Shewanella gelidii TaxID=1642821 RepID=A0A917ND88_9GAMM|nr:methyl-accepting chemotaxis protein [Shewanella gelidii]MCL1099383.1 methyl-accepting chemotaxis protein [Shewanella gelidii]GGI91370.1 methyl-accepting chemotaxis protein [Shewanella gelidii]